MHIIRFFFNDTATTEIYPLSLHDALPIWLPARWSRAGSDDEPIPAFHPGEEVLNQDGLRFEPPALWSVFRLQYCELHQHRSEEHTSELQSRQYLVCRLLLEKKKHNFTLFN